MMVRRSLGSGVQLVLERALQKLLGFILVGIFVEFSSLRSSGIRVLNRQILTGWQAILSLSLSLEELGGKDSF